jgi:HK97 family phage major capsid protein/HK97 family phage prohead protease
VTQTRAYAVLTIKAVDTDQRTISGIASTPEPDRMGDVVEPLGITFKNPLPLLLYHDTQKPVGSVRLGPPALDGIAFEATLPTVAEAGALRDRIDEAWHSIKAGLLAGVSIGFRALETAKHTATGGIRFLKTEILELSLVAIPANAAATIHTIKALDLAASGPHPPRDRGPQPNVRAEKGVPVMEHKTTHEQITAFETTRAAKHARLTAIMNTSAAAGATLNEAETEEYDGLAAEVKAIDAHLVRLRALEATMMTTATPVPTTTTPAAASDQRGGVPVIQVRSLLPKGTGFVRFVQGLAACKGNLMQAEQYAKQWDDSTPEVGLVFKAAVAAGTTTDATWAGPLAPLMPLSNEFLELLRPATILGKVPGFRRVPFNVTIASQTGGGTYQWVGQGAPKPVGKLQFGSVSLTITKCAGIVVITLELARTSTPSAEAVIRQDMINGIAAFLDVEFTDPSKAAVAGVSPGSVTNGVTPITTAGTSPANARTDIQALAAAMTAAGVPIGGAVLLMSTTNALALSNALNALGQPLFPSMSLSGGTIMGGLTVIPSQAMGTTVALVQPDAILYADDDRCQSGSLGADGFGARQSGPRDDGVDVALAKQSRRVAGGTLHQLEESARRVRAVHGRDLHRVIHMDESVMLPRVTMAVIRDGFFDGTWHVRGERLDVDASLVETLELAGFAVRRTEGSDHGVRIGRGDRAGLSHGKR